jgi:hypothetical protein
MNKSEANTYAGNMNKHDDLFAEVVRILPEHIDPIKSGDNGWDVKVTHLPCTTFCED